MAVQISKEQIKNNAVDQSKLDGTANFSFSGQVRYTGSDTNANALATRSYVDSVAAGLDPKDSCKVATTANITLSNTQRLTVYQFLLVIVYLLKTKILHLKMVSTVVLQVRGNVQTTC